jgi:hypothetical protein
VEYLLNGKLVTRVGNVGIPLDKQGVKYTGIYPSLGPGESLAGKIDSFSIGHGLQPDRRVQERQPLGRAVPHRTSTLRAHRG